MSSTLTSPSAQSRLPGSVVACAHCGLEVPSGLIDPHAAQQFCCNGCRTVFQVLEANGLSAYYSLRNASGAVPRSATTTDRSYEAFDEPKFQSLYCHAASTGQNAIDLYLEGVHCSACVWLVERLPTLVEGTTSALLDIGRSIVTLSYDPERVQLSTLARALDRLGYPPHPVRGADAILLRRNEQRRLLIRMGVAAAAAGNAMLMALALYSGEFSGMEPSHVALFRWGSLMVTLPAVFWSALPFFRGALGSFRARVAHMDLPIAIGISVGFIGGTVATLRGGGVVYFDTITVLIFLLLVGRFIQLRQQDMARSAAELLYSLAPSTARRVDPDGIKVVSAETLLPGDELEILANEHVPADGIVISGTSSLDTSWLTGEPMPEVVEPGSPICAGTTNMRSTLRMRVLRSGLETRVAQLMQAVQDASRRRARVVRLADRISGKFVLAILVFAGLTVVGWSFWDWTRGFENAVALLVVTCPCALGMATPLAVTAALGKAARAGIFVKGGDALEALAQAELVVLDKTGTLTEGQLALIAWEGDASVKSAVSAMEQLAVHPVAAAMVRALGIDEKPMTVEGLVHYAGGGICADVDGEHLAVGSPRWHEELGHSCERSLFEKIDEHVALGHTPVLISKADRVVALAVFADQLRGDTVVTLMRLRSLGLRLAVLSGDDDRAVQALVSRLGVDFEFARGGVSPEAKLSTIEALAKHTRVAMVGDGVNDAAALSAATVGIAVHGGAEVSFAAADAFSTVPGLANVANLIEGSRRTFRVIRRGLVFSLAYNAMGTALALGGWLNPLVAAILMPLSSLTVVTSAYRGKTFTSPRPVAAD
ncbi:MAG TPA: heavy metal translocating P-type ATPase [Polyangiaceae bacterium]